MPVFFRRARARRLVAALTAVLVAGTVGAVSLAPAAAADTSPPAGVPATVSADPLPTVQIDGVVWAQVVVGTTVYVTGSFAFARPAGQPATSTQRVARANLLAYNITTGVLISSFNHSLNNQGRTIAASPDGTRVYVGGDFTTVDGVKHDRLAAFSTATGALVSTFNPDLNNTVRAIVATNSTVYVGGIFNVANNKSHLRLAAYTSAGALTGWTPSADAGVFAMVMAPDQSRLVIAGGFRTLSGASRYGIGAASTIDGSSEPWSAAFPIRDYGQNSTITSLVADATDVYGSAYSFGGGNFEGRFAVNPNTGELAWLNSCHGDSYSTFLVGGILYSASHEHDCSDIGGFSQDNALVYQSTVHHLEAETITASGIARAPIYNVYADFSGQPHSTQLNWYPTLAIGAVTGAGQAAWSVSGTATYLTVGGEFPSVNGVAQQGLVRYEVASNAPNKVGPQAIPAPAGFSQATGSVRVSWRADWDQDNSTLVYRLFRDGVSTPIATATLSNTFYQRPMMGFNDSGFAPGTSHTYRVTVTDPYGNVTTSPTSAAVIVSSATRGRYVSMIRADGASSLWPFSESAGSTAFDAAGFTDLTVRSAMTFAAPGPIPGQGTAANLSGAVVSATASDSVASAVSDAQPRSTYTLEGWVKTSSTTGGAVLSDSVLPAEPSGGLSPDVDRVLYFDNDGKINFGVFSSNSDQTLTSPGAYNDGVWHLITATMGTGGAKIFVDGAQVAVNAALTDNSVFWGHWRVGGDSLSRWTPKPTSNYLAASVADVAVYSSALTPARIQAHFDASKVTGPPPTTPTASFTSNCSLTSCSFNGNTSSVPSGTVTGYQWAFGDGTSATGVTATHAYPTTGTYQVTLTVTASNGATGSTTHPVVVSSPTGTGPFATDTFQRSISSGWGSANIGGAWTTLPAANFAVAPGTGTIRLTAAGASQVAYLNSVRATIADLTSTVALDKVPTGGTGGVYFSVVGRRVATNEQYDALVKLAPNRSVTLAIRKVDGSSSEVNLASVVSGLTYTAGTKINIRFQVSGSYPTLMQMKAWTTGNEPSTWALSTTDSSPAVQIAGAVGLSPYVSGTVTNAPIVAAVTAFSAKPVA